MKTITHLVTIALRLPRQSPHPSDPVQIVGRALRLPDQLRGMFRATEAVALHLVIFMTSMAVAGEISPTPGRLTGWGLVGKGKPLENTLPKGWAAENVVQFSAGGSEWAAVREDGSLVSGGAHDWIYDIPKNLPPAKAVATGGGFVIVLLRDGTVVHWGGSSELKAWAKNLSDIVAIEAGESVAYAIRADGSVSFAGNRHDPDAWQVKNGGKAREGQIERNQKLNENLKNVVAIEVLESSGMALRKDGSVVTWITITPEEDRVNVFRVDGTRIDTPIQQISVGIGSTIGLTQSGKYFRDSGPIAPVEYSKITAVSAGRFFAAVQLVSGEWKLFGKDEFNTVPDPSRLESLLDFEFGGRGVGTDSRSFVIGIEPSYAGGFSGQIITHAELKTALDEFEQQRLAADDELVAFEDRYLAELEKLKAAAAKNNRPKIVTRIENEITNFRDRSRPAFDTIKRLVDLQKIYRDGAPNLEKKRDAAVLAVYETAVTNLQTLQDELTQAQKLPAAVEVRSHREKVASALELLKTPAEKTTGPGGKATVLVKFDPIPEEKRIFSADDPEDVAGEMVLIGKLNNNPIPLPKNSVKRDVKFVTGGAHGWLALKSDGEPVYDSSNGRIASADVPSDARRLVSASTAGFQVGINDEGKIVAWALDPAWEDKPLEDRAETVFPPHPAIGYKKLTMEYYDAIALKNDGTIAVWGRHYADKRFPWKKPEGFTNVKDIAITSGTGAVLLENGDVMSWNDTIGKTPIFKNGRKVLGGVGHYVCLLNDGTVMGRATAANAGAKDAAAVPHGLTDVVDIAAGDNISLALRADGTWVGWGDNQDGLLDRLDEVRGVRRLASGGDADQGRFLIGIRLDPGELKLKP